MEINKTTCKRIGILFIISIFIINGIFAFAVSCLYGDKYPLNINPGETKDIQIVLQNSQGPGEISVKGIITQGSDIAQLIDENDIYTVAVKQKTDVNIRVSIPKDVEINDTYDIILSFATITSGEAGTFGFGSAIDKKIPIVVTKKIRTQEEKTMIWIYVIAGLIALVILVIIIIRIIKKRK